MSQNNPLDGFLILKNKSENLFDSSQVWIWVIFHLIKSIDFSSATWFD